MVSDIISSGIRGLDELLGGGIPLKHSVLLMGTPGTGKTSVGLQFLVAGARLGEAGMYITLEQETSTIFNLAKVLNWNLEELGDQGKFFIVDIADQDIDLKSFLDNLGSTIEATGCKRIVIDPLTLLENSRLPLEKLRKEIYRLVISLKKLGCTVFYILERERLDLKAPSFTFHEFLMDGVIIFLQLLVQNEFKIVCRVLKMRSTQHSNRLHSVTFRAGEGVDIIPFT
jgi:circadian clock protein KaiC